MIGNSEIKRAQRELKVWMHRAEIMSIRIEDENDKKIITSCLDYANKTYIEEECIDVDNIWACRDRLVELMAGCGDLEELVVVARQIRIRVQGGRLIREQKLKQMIIEQIIKVEDQLRDIAENISKGDKQKLEKVRIDTRALAQVVFDHCRLVHGRILAKADSLRITGIIAWIAAVIIAIVTNALTASGSISAGKIMLGIGTTSAAAGCCGAIAGIGLKAFNSEAFIQDVRRMRWPLMALPGLGGLLGVASTIMMKSGLLFSTLVGTSEENSYYAQLGVSFLVGLVPSAAYKAMTSMLPKIETDEWRINNGK